MVHVGMTATNQNCIREEIKHLRAERLVYVTQVLTLRNSTFCTHNVFMALYGSRN